MIALIPVVVLRGVLLVAGQIATHATNISMNNVTNNQNAYKDLLANDCTATKQEGIDVICDDRVDNVHSI